MDAPSTVFELHADGADRSILVTGLTDDPAPGPDAVAIQAFADLVARLRTIATDADYATDGVVARPRRDRGAPRARSSATGRSPTSRPRDFPQPPTTRRSRCRPAC